MDLEQWIDWARGLGASDLHLEPGLPATVRVRGELRAPGERVSGQDLKAKARQLLGEERWGELVERRSADLSRTVSGVRCRINVLHSTRGLGMAIRLLSSPAATLKKLNLHPSLSGLVQVTHGLLLVSGPTGSGKTSTVAALLQEINLAESRHIITLESPIEYALAPRRSLIRQREIGRDTPSFAQGLYDAMREDPDVLMVGELREPEVMQLTLNAAETGHLVIATLHSATPGEALQRVVSAFPAEIQPGICAQLGDCLVGVVAQRLVYRHEQGLRVPECEILTASSGARALIRQGQFFKLPTVLESGAADGCWSLARYRAWLDAKQEWAKAEATAPEEVEERLEEPRQDAGPPAPSRPSPRAEKRLTASTAEDGRLVIDDDADDLGSLIEELEGKRRPQ